MKPLAPSPRLVEIALADATRALREAMAHVDLAKVEAQFAHKRENAAELRLHMVHDFLHRELHESARRGCDDDWDSGVLERLAAVLGYPEGSPDRHDVKSWIDADKPTPVRRAIDAVDRAAL